MLIYELIDNKVSPHSDIKFRIRSGDQTFLQDDYWGERFLEYMETDQTGATNGSIALTFETMSWSIFQFDWQGLQDFDESFLGQDLYFKGSSYGGLDDMSSGVVKTGNNPHSKLMLAGLANSLNINHDVVDLLPTTQKHVLYCEWEQEYISAIATLPYGWCNNFQVDNINVSDGLDPSSLPVNPMNNLWHTLFSPNYGLYTGNINNYPSELIDNKTILWNVSKDGFYLIKNENGSYTDYSHGIEPEFNYVIDQWTGVSISDFDINSTANRSLYIPITFTKYSTDFDLSVNILPEGIIIPSSVVEEDSISGEIQVKSEDFNGTIDVYVFDSSSIESGDYDSIIAEINDNDSVFDVGEDTSCAYGSFMVGDQPNHKTYTISSGEVLTIPVTYTALGDVFLGQIDNFAIYVKTSTIDIQSYSNQEAAQSTWDSITNHYDVVVDQEITVLDSAEFAAYQEPYIPDYNALIEKPSDILYHLLDIELGYDKDVDSNSLIDSRNNHDSWRMAFCVNEDIDSRTLIEEFSKSTKLICSLNNNLLKFFNVKDTYNGLEEKQTIKSADVINYNFSRTDIEDVKTRVEVKYSYDYGIGDFTETTGELRVNSHILEDKYFTTGTYKDILEGNTSPINYYGIKHTNYIINSIDNNLIFESKYIRDLNTANKLAEHLLFWHCNQHNKVSLTLPLKYYALQVGDLIEFDEMLFGRKLYGESYVLNDPNDMAVRCGQYILPLFMITETKKGLNSVKISATQLHHMQDGGLTFNDVEYSIDGDIGISNEVYGCMDSGANNYNPLATIDNGSCTYDPDDPEIYGCMDETATNYNPLATINEGCVYPPSNSLAGDVNLDGEVRVNDIVLIVNHILSIGEPLTDQALINADVGGFSGGVGGTGGAPDVTVSDIVLVVNIILGFDDEG